MMKTIGFPISHKENEYRRALIPNDISKIVNRKNIFIEFDYGKVLGFSDNDFRDLGVNVVSREVVLQQDIICDPKIGDADYVRNLSSQTIFGWIHAVQNRQITDILMNHKLTAYAWEEMIYKGRHLFWENNEIAGEAAVIHAFQCYGILPRKTKVAILGKGNIARGAQRALICFGAEITVYDRKTESLLREELSKYDVVINAILWDIRRKDHIIYREDLKKMKKGAMIIDISCDKAGGIETSVPTTINNPLYEVEGIVHYVVDHTPSLFYKTVSKSLSEVVSPFYDVLIEDKYNTVLQNCLIVKDGIIEDKKILDFQGR